MTNNNLREGKTGKKGLKTFFPVWLPNQAQRLQLWQNAFTPHCRLAADIDLPKLADKHTITGAAIINVLRCCSLRALSRGNADITLSNIKHAIRKEMQKKGKIVL